MNEKEKWIDFLRERILEFENYGIPDLMRDHKTAKLEKIANLVDTREFVKFVYENKEAWLGVVRPFDYVPNDVDPLSVVFLCYCMKFSYSMVINKQIWGAFFMRQLDYEKFIERVAECGQENLANYMDRHYLFADSIDEILQYVV